VERGISWTTLTPSIRLELNNALDNMQVYSSADNVARHLQSYSGKLTLPFEQVLDFVEHWSVRAVVHLEHVCAAPNLHLPYRGYQFDATLNEKEVVLFSGLICVVGGKDMFNCGELGLLIYRLKRNRYYIRYSDEDDWETWAKETERIARSPISQLRHQGELIYVP